MSEFPQYLSTVFAVGAGTTAVFTKTLGFLADFVELQSTAAQAIYVNLQGAGVATTQDYQLASGANKVWEGIGIGEMTFYTTSTVAGGMSARLTAMQKLKTA